MNKLNQETKQGKTEPIAWMVYTLDGKSVCVTDNPADFSDQHQVLPLYTAPIQHEYVGLDLAEMDEIINGNVTITDSRLRDGLYGIVLDTMTALMDKNNITPWDDDKESADVKAMGEAQIVLNTIKDTDPGVYDEMIDNALRLIHEALSISR